MINKNNKPRSRFWLLIFATSENEIKSKSKFTTGKGRGEKNNSVIRRPKIGEMAKKVAVMGFVVINILSMTLFPLNGTLAAR